MPSYIESIEIDTDCFMQHFHCTGNTYFQFLFFLPCPLHPYCQKYHVFCIFPYHSRLLLIGTNTLLTLYVSFLLFRSELC